MRDNIGLVGHAIGCGITEDELGIINFGYVLIECHVSVFQELFVFLFQVPSQLTTGCCAIVTSCHGLLENAYGLIVSCLSYFNWSFTVYSVTGCGLIDYDCTLVNGGYGLTIIGYGIIDLL